MSLQVFDIHKTYQQSDHPLHVLKGIDLTVEQGEFISIVGPSGAGKSTLLHIMGGLDDPSQGTVLLEGKDIYKIDDAQRANIRNEKIGFVFQFYHLLPEFSALENVLLPAYIKAKKKSKEVDQLAEQALVQVGLKERLKHRPNQLSGGEQQRVAIARALINKPKLIFCDEPTGNLDTQTGEEIIELLVELNKGNNQTLMIVTHDEGIARLSNRNIYIRDGKLN